ncbi:MAG: heavy metal translocating P-type ATPase [Clostridia bacterium]|nr:heavy metal translocating P-type ATPase [Clostridia bacterium]
MGDCCLHDEHNHCHEHEHEESNLVEYIFTVIGILFFIVAILIQNNNISFYLYLLSYLLIGYKIIWNAIKRLFKKDMFDENFIMTIATIGAFAIGEYKEAIAVLLFYKVGEFLQDKAVENSKKKIKGILDMRAEYANLKKGDDIQRVDPKKVSIGDTIVVKTGEKVPLDGVIIYGNTELDMSSLSGESIPKNVKEKDEVLSGSVNIGGVIEIEVTSSFENSTVSQIIDLIENATSKKSKTEKFITRFAKVYTPIVTLLAIFILILLPLVFQLSFSEALTRACTFLVVSCPCALVISVPLGFFVGIGTCSKNGILIKGSNYLDILNQVDAIVFDKTGTLTKGVFKVTKTESLSEKYSKEQVLEYIAHLEYFSNHYIAKSVMNSFDGKMDVKRVTSHEEIAGFGIVATMDNKSVICGNKKLMKKEKIELPTMEEEGTIIYLAVDNSLIGYAILSDEIKEDSILLVEKLNKLGKYDVYMLTGDNQKTAENIARKLNIQKVFSELLPNDKAKILEEIKKDHQKVMYVGDGINDSPVLALADVGVSMGKGSDIAIETSDMVLMTDSPIKIIDSIKISRKTKKIVSENIAFALLIKVLFLIFSGFGIVGMWFAVFADVGVALIAILNSLRIFRFKNR